MKRFFASPAAVLLLAVFVSFGTFSCSRKSGCPAEDVHVKTDKDGNYKAGKTTSGLLPPKGKKKRKKN
jgi:hypothetical protein